MTLEELWNKPTKEGGARSMEYRELKGVVQEFVRLQAAKQGVAADVILRAMRYTVDEIIAGR